MLKRCAEQMSVGVDEIPAGPMMDIASDFKNNLLKTDESLSLDDAKCLGVVCVCKSAVSQVADVF